MAHRLHDNSFAFSSIPMQDFEKNAFASETKSNKLKTEGLTE